MTTGEAVERIVGALAEVDGLHPATSSSPVGREGTAVDLSPGVVRVRLIATRLPIPPLLDRAAQAVRAVLAGTEWENARLRLVITDLDGAAFPRLPSQ
ncbi:hypothetical protein AB0L41_14665 [Amycolatopsis mediterranei]|uniref:hypothetical protein n=1 Tax=Amycolatopsis mediterranei TaxID=33910 RepID=UPI00341382FA